MNIPHVKFDGVRTIFIPTDYQPPKVEPKPDNAVTVYAYNQKGQCVGKTVMPQSDWDSMEQDEW